LFQTFNKSIKVIVLIFSLDLSGLGVSGFVFLVGSMGTAAGKDETVGHFSCGR
jgi:hypothetical protein